MTYPETILQRSWTVGGYDIDPKDKTALRKWRDQMVSVRLEKEVKEVTYECGKLLHPYVGSLDTEPGFNTILLLDEAGVNLWGHGKKGDPSKPSTIALEIKRLQEDAHLFSLHMQDDLDVFDIESLPDPTFDENLCEVTGRGILLIRKKCKAIIRQQSLDCGGKLMEYEWRNPVYSFAEVGLQVDTESD